MLFAVPGLLATLGGLLGLYPRLADRSPRLARAGGIATVVAGGGLLVTVAWSVGGDVLSAAMQGDVPASPPEIVFVSLIAALALAAALFGVAGLRAGGPWRRVGRFLLGYAATYVALVAAGIALTAVPNWLYFAIYGGQPVALLVTGSALRRGLTPTDHDLPTDETVTG